MERLITGVVVVISLMGIVMCLGDRFMPDFGSPVGKSMVAIEQERNATARQAERERTEQLAYQTRIQEAKIEIARIRADESVSLERIRSDSRNDARQYFQQNMMVICLVLGVVFMFGIGAACLVIAVRYWCKEGALPPQQFPAMVHQGRLDHDPAGTYAYPMEVYHGQKI